MLDAGVEALRLDVAVQREDALGDVLGQVADALEIAGDALCRDDFAQIHRHRLTPGDDHDGALFAFALQDIELLVIGDDRAGGVDIDAHQRPDRDIDQALGHAAHLGDPAGDVV